MSEKLHSFLYKIAVIWLIYNAVSFFSPFLRTVSLDTLVFKNNDGRTVVLQAMSHVAPEDFYTHVNHNIKSFLNIHNDGKIFLEGIYNGENLETDNIKIIDKAIKRTDNYINYLKNFIDKTKGDIDLDNPNSKFMEYCHLLTFLNKELEKVRLHQEYLNDFKYQLFPPDDEVI